jgi:hypothetical protein
LRRIIADEVVFASELCPAYIEHIGRDQVPPLHLPSGADDCPFCQR